jgi:Reverse transcriptase (RNA-dependent DNA polymerase)
MFQAKMDRVIYVTLPAALAEVFPDLAKWFGVPLLSEKAAYGINAAGQLWAEEQFTWYLEYGFTQSTVDPSLFYYTKGEDWIVLLSYCDDTAYFASTDEVRQRFETAMCKRFECKLMNQMHWFLQARITQHANFDITIDQLRYAVSMCSRFLPNHELAKPSEKDRNTYLAPLPANFVFSKKDCCADSSEYKKLVDEFGFEYPVAIGCLLWILNTYPRLQFAIRKLAKFTRSPGRLHFNAILHLLHHVRCHHNAGLHYYSDVFDAPVSQLLFDEGIDPSKSPFYVFADSSWQDCPDTGRSTGGYHIFMQGGIVDSAMTFPTPVALSTAEAEYNNASAAATAVASMSMLTQDLKQLRTDIPLKIPLMIDNKACIAMGENFRDSKHTRHILRRYHYVRYMLEKNYIDLQWIPADFQLADPITKCLPGTSPSLMLFRALGEVPVTV